VCYNRYPPHVYSNKLYSSQLLALLFGCVCLRHRTLNLDPDSLQTDQNTAL
jgi:hypothetical protein